MLDQSSEGRITIRLAELVAARICHDLGSPMASISALMPQAADPAAHAVVTETAGELRARLRLFGAMFGLADELGWPELDALVRGAPMAHRVRFALPLRGGPFAPGRARLYLAAVLLAAEALPRGGVVHVTESGPGALALRLEGRQTEWSPTLLNLLAGGSVEAALEEGPRRLLAPWVFLLAARERHALSLAMPVGEGEPMLLLQPDM
ncbi:MAG TPA: histidine phosphotransferase family protein [Roseococcus sp.]|jgi:hypothetical protein|nr:histidine phosphotransferase family protein [Roseococcus sp.]